MEENEFSCRSCSAEPTNTINVRRFFEKLDACFDKNDLEGAKNVLDFWATEARGLGDYCGLLSVLNEKIGFTRRNGDKATALATAEEIESIIDKGGRNRVSVATVLVNLGTTLNHFNEGEKGLKYFEEAEKTYDQYCMDESYEYASLLNNRAATYIALNKKQDALRDYKRALAILEKLDGSQKEQAETYANIAELIAPDSIKEADENLDKCWEKLTDETLAHDGEYAFTLTKCAPAFRNLGREIEAEVLTDIAKEIYSA